MNSQRLIIATGTVYYIQVSCKLLYTVYEARCSYYYYYYYYYYYLIFYKTIV